MDIELSLRQILVLRDPGVRFTDGVMSRVGDAPVSLPREGVVQLAEARARKRGRSILIAAVVALAAAAAISTVMLQDRIAPPVVVQEAAPQPASAQPPAPAESGLPLQVQSEHPGESANPQECVDLDVVHGLLLHGAFNVTFGTAADLPPEMSGFKAPRQLTLIGSTVRTPVTSQVPTSVAVAYRSSLAPAAARAAGVKALVAGGWSLRPSSSPFPVLNVFRSTNTMVSSETWCREGRPVSIVASAIDDVTYVILSASRNVDRNPGFRNACEQPPQPSPFPSSVLDSYMPALEMPRDPATGKQIPARGGGGSIGDVKRRVSTSFTTTDSIGNVAQHFARQLAEQGWNSEASWSGSATAGSTWTRQMDADTVLQGMLVVSAFDDGRFTTEFHVVQTK